MNRTLVDKLARALLYEGYVLYPYRPSVKNSQRWTFGGIYPRCWTDVQGDACSMLTQCLVSGSDQTCVQVIVRFLHLVDRTVGQLITPTDQMPDFGEPPFYKVQSLQVGDETHQSWQEAEEREIDLADILLSDLLWKPQRTRFDFPAWQTVRPLRAAPEKITGVLFRKQHAVQGSIEISANRLTDSLFKLSVMITNESNLSDTRSRDNALMHSLVSTHTILGAVNGQFVSQTDPPDPWRDLAAGCRNMGTWPVLVGDDSQHDTMLSSPIILADYPQLAPESPGDLFDSTEIDEILTLRILTLTDEEKRAACGVDDRVKDLMARTQALARDQLMNLHGTLRGLQPVEQHHA